MDACLEALANLEKFCDERFEDDAPAFTKLKNGLTEVRQTVHTLLNKKREKEPDPVEVVPVAAAPEAKAGGDGGNVSPAWTGAPVGMVVAEPADRLQAVSSIAAAAAFLASKSRSARRPISLLRGLRWGELRTASRLGDSTLLEGPPTELRQRVKRLALGKHWSELLGRLRRGYGSALQPGMARLAASLRRCLLGSGRRLPTHRHRHPVRTSGSAE